MFLHNRIRICLREHELQGSLDDRFTAVTHHYILCIVPVEIKCGEQGQLFFLISRNQIFFIQTFVRWNLQHHAVRLC